MFREAIVGMAMTLVLGIPARDSRADGADVALLQANQIDRLKSRYVDPQVFRVCQGRFGGLNAHDAVVGLLSKGVVHRVGLIWDGAEWVLHDIDTEMKQDSAISRALPMRWNYVVTGDPKDDFRCDLHLGKDDRIGVEGDKPFFDLKQLGLDGSTAVCFETDETYNDWDCVVYSPKDWRFRLWFQQAHAD